MTNIEEIQKEIELVKKSLMQIGDMRPGNLNQQFRKPKEKLGEYYQLNYTFKGKTRTEHVRKENIDRIKSEIDAYQKSKELYMRWIELSIQVSKLKGKGS
jgi:hypothetical protein